MTKKTKKRTKQDKPTPEEVANLINSELGYDAVSTADSTLDMKIVRRPTGLAGLDIALGGGFPAGTIHVIAGVEAVGKDALINMLLRMNQRIYGEDACVFIGNTESGHDKIWARKMGVKIAMSDKEISDYEAAHGEKFGKETVDKLKEQIGAVYISNEHSARNMYGTILKLAAMDVCQMFFINSVDSLLSAASAEDPTNAERSNTEGMTSAADLTSFVNKFLMVAGRKSNGTYPTLFLVQQGRANIDGFGWGARKYKTDTGAYALKHLKIIDLLLKNKGQILGSKKTKIGKTIEWTTQKAKFGTHDGVRGEYALFFESGPDRVGCLIDTMAATGNTKVGSPGVIHLMRDGETVISGNRDQLKEKLTYDDNLFYELYSWLVRKECKNPFLLRER